MPQRRTMLSGSPGSGWVEAWTGRASEREDKYGRHESGEALSVCESVGVTATGSLFA